MRYPLLMAWVALSACDDADCPGPATLRTEGVAAWCATAAGVRDGTYTETVAGTVTVEGQYRAGQQTGSWQWRWPDGSLREVGEFDDDEPIGTWRRWTEDGVELPPRRRSRATTESEGTVLDRAHPDPAVVLTTWLGAPVGTPRRVGDIVLAPQSTGMVAIDATTGQVRWQADAASRLAERPLADGLRTAIAFTESGDAFVVRLTEALPSTDLIELNARAMPEPVANDFGIAYVDEAGVLVDQPLDPTRRSAPAVNATTLNVAADRLFVGTDSGELVHWERIEERERWRIDVGGVVRRILAPNWQTVYAITNSQVIAVDFASGDVMWRSPVRSTRDDAVWVRGDDVLMERLGSVAVRDALTGALTEDITATALRGPIVAVDPSGLASMDEDELRIARDGALTLHARIDHPSAPLIETDGAWVGTRAGLLLKLQPVRTAPPSSGYWTGRTHTRLEVGGRPVPAGRWLAWRDESVSAMRTALPLGDQRGGETVLTTHWVDLPGDDGPMQRSWADGWTHRSETAWRSQVGGVDLLTTATPPPRQPRSGAWAVDGWVAHGDEWTRADAVVIATTEEGPELVAGDWAVPLSNVRATPWQRVTLTTATWTGVPIAPWIEAWTVQPDGWLGWTPPPKHAPDAPIGESQ